MAKTWEELRAYRKAYYRRNKAAILRKMRKYRKDNLSRLKLRDRKRYLVLAEKAKSWGLPVGSANPKMRKALRAARKKERLEVRRKKEALYATYSDYERAQQRSDLGKWKTYTQSARRQKRPWSLSQAQFFELIRAPCHYHGGDDPARGVDRVDSAKGYFVGNVVPCCAVCNRMKNAFGVDLFLSRCHIIAKRFPETPTAP